MNSKQFLRFLQKQHGIIAESKTMTGHKNLINPENGKTSQIPMHGGSKQLGTGLMNKILKDLGLR